MEHQKTGQTTQKINKKQNLHSKKFRWINISFILYYVSYSDTVMLPLEKYTAYDQGYDDGRYEGEQDGYEKGLRDAERQNY